MNGQSKDLKGRRSPRRRAAALGITLGAAIIISAAAMAAHKGNFRVSLRKAKNPAVLYKSDTWFQAFNDEDTPDLARDAGVQFGRETADKICTLTFDDGPHPAVTPKLAAVLLKLRVPATFFVIGKMVDRFPYLVKMEADDGFDIGNHSYSHVTLTRLGLKDLMTEYKACDMAVERAAGTTPHWTRPPGGDVSLRTVRAAAANGLVTTLWSDDPGDYAIHSADKIYQETVKSLKPGAIILLHDGNMATVQALPRIVAWARSHGYRFVRLRDMPVTRVK